MDEFFKMLNLNDSPKPGPSDKSKAKKVRKQKKKNLECIIEKLKEQKAAEEAYETDPVVFARRQKQIDYGKNTEGYAKYLKLQPKLVG